MKFMEIQKTEMTSLPPTRTGHLAGLQMQSALEGFADCIPQQAMDRFRAEIAPRILTLWLAGGGINDLEIIFDPAAPAEEIAAAFSRQARVHQSLVILHLGEIAEILEGAMAEATAP